MPEPVIQRYLEAPLRDDALAARKMAFVTGARQVGKTTLGRALLSEASNVFSWDDQRFRRAWVKDPLGALESRGPGPVLLDEIHKDRRWKSRLKGVYDLRGQSMRIVVTGSARLDFFRRGGDSLMGRYLPYRLHQLSAGERPASPGPDDILREHVPLYPVSDMLRLGGFPEPLLAGSEPKARRWSRLRLERLVYEDLRDFRHIHDLQALRTLVDLLAERVGSVLSMNSLREDVGVAFATVRDWIHVLEALFHLFLIRPFAGRLQRTLKAEPKLFLYDALQIPGEGARLENLTALHLLKACHYWTDLAHGVFELRFLRTKEKEEVDFVVIRDGRPWMLVECKSEDTEPAPALTKYASILKAPLSFQLVRRAGFDRVYAGQGVRVLSYDRFLAGLV
jgi:predicted AAA+ superfamily ATPase